MASIPQIQGMLLEEAILYLLKLSGYQVAEASGTDPTLATGPAGLLVKGRGGQHQIDAVADYRIVQPFGHPQRLLIEAKFRKPEAPVGIEIVRNAVGVLKDVSEFWATERYSPLESRYHYLYALFSAAAFTAVAEKYAFAQDVYLMPLAQSPFMRPIIDAIARIKYQWFGAWSSRRVEVDMTALRRGVRRQLQGIESGPAHLAIDSVVPEGFAEFIQACRTLRWAVLGMIAHRFPAFLVPSPELTIADLFGQDAVRIRWSEQGWYLQSRIDNRLLFSFDLPPVLFSLYANRTQDVEKDDLREIQAVVIVDGEPRLVTLNLDQQSLYTVRERTSAIRREREEQAQEEE